jgi:hypothetical protein
MRLTLRTLLAYLDDVLDPADKEALGKKIESSEFAMDLVHRTKDTMRRLRLSAPQVVGTGMGLDPNSVAEYLDNVMPPESVGDFERICLESDMHLAEVSSCHHVLTMVLGQPADIDPAAKQRMYTIPMEVAERKQTRLEQAHAAVGQAITPPQAVGAALAAQPAAPARHAEIPEYLRPTGLARYRGLILGLAAVLLVGTGLYFFGALDRWFASDATQVAIAPPVGDVASIDVPAPTAVAPATTHPIAPAPSEPLTNAPATTAPSVDGPNNTTLPAAEPSGPAIGAPGTETTATAPPIETVPADPVATPAGVGDDPARSVGSRYTETTPPTAEPESQATIPQGAPVTNAAPDNMPAAAARTTPAPPAETTAPGAVEVDPDGTVRVGGSVPAPAVNAAPAEIVAPVEPEALKVVDLGTYRGGKTVLLRYDDAAGTWVRMAPRSPVVMGQRLLALPEFRPNVALSNGVHMDLLGGTLVALSTVDGGAADAGAGGAQPIPAAGRDRLSPGQATSPVIEVVYGRAVLINTLNEERSVRLVLGPTSGEARLAQNATLAIELERKYVPGNDPQKTAAPVIARLYVPDGGVTWQDSTGTTAIETASQWEIADGVSTAVVASASPPAWIDHDTVPQSSEQRYAVPVIETGLASNRPADVQLLELFQGNGRREVKSLVARSGMHVGLYVPFIEALRDSAQRPNWDTHIQALRAAMAMNPESAQNIRKALVEQRGEAAAADLYEMLCGYNADQVGHTPEQIKTGAIARLIGWLDQDSLDYRVLAKYDLWEITGKQLMPNPAGSVAERKLNIKKWRARLDDGELGPVAREQ